MIRILGFSLLSFLLVSKTYAQTTSTILNPSQDCSATYSGSNVAVVNNNDLVTSYGLLSTRIFIQFDLSSIPADAIITGATLKLPIVSEAFSDLTVQRIVSAWSETAMSSFTAPTLTTTNQQSTSTTTGVIYRNFDVLLMVKDMRTTLVNHGFVVRKTTETGTITNQYSSSNTATKPRLDISWYQPIKITAAVVTAASSTTATDGAITPTVSGGPGGTYTYTWWKDNTVSSFSSTLNQSNLGYGCYYLRITPPSGDPGYMAFLVGVKCEVVTIPFSRTSDMHLFIDDALYKSNVFPQTANSGNAVNIFSKRSNAGSEFTWMRFRLWMDNNIDPINAKLYMYNDGHGTAIDNSSKIISITSDWQEMTVSPATAPTTSSAITINVPATLTTTEDKEIEISDFWNQWKANNATNYGMYFLLQNATGTTYRGQEYHSSDATDVSKRPTISFVVDDATCDRTNYTLFKPETDAGYAPTFQGKLKFYFVEEYQIDPGKKIPLSLYDENNVLVAAIDVNGAAISGKPLLPAFNYTFDDNRQVLNLTSYGLTAGKFYILQLTHDNGTKEYIKFIYTN